MNLFHKNKYKTLNLIEISKSALLNNFNFFQKLQPNSKICPVLKSNAYGHGLKLIGKFVDNEIKPEFICVDSLYEAYELKKLGIKAKILIVGYTFPQNFKFNKFDFRVPLFDLGTLKYLNNYCPGVSVHLKIDTGMNRLGIKEDQYEIFAKELKKNNKIRLEGIYSHLADFENERFSSKQINKFNQAVKYFESQGFGFKWKHLFATGGAVKYQNENTNLVRLGLGFYGLSKENNLKPCLKFISHLIDIKEISKGESVGYNKGFIAKNNLTIGFLPVGYYDGISRKLSNRASFYVKGKESKIIGNVCMNITAVDLTNIEKPTLGTEVEIVNNDKDAKNSISNLSLLAETIPYEFVSRLSETTRRIMVD